VKNEVNHVSEDRKDQPIEDGGESNTDAVFMSRFGNRKH
jgi:hypothetical protein